MYFSQLRSFQAVALEGSFTNAAKRLNLSQPTITQQVRQLETVYGVELFYRLGRRIELREVGRSLLTATERLFTMSEEAIELLESASGQGTGHLRISAVGPLDVIPVIALVAKANPAARISLTICNSEVAQQSLMEFRADVAIWRPLRLILGFIRSILDHGLLCSISTATKSGQSGVRKYSRFVRSETDHPGYWFPHSIDFRASLHDSRHHAAASHRDQQSGCLPRGGGPWSGNRCRRRPRTGSRPKAVPTSDQ